MTENDEKFVPTGITEAELTGTVAIALDGLKILLVKTEYGIFALQNICPHQSRELVDAEIVGDQLRCIHHQVTIDLPTGNLSYTAGFTGLKAVQTYPVRIFDGQVEVDTRG